MIFSIKEEIWKQHKTILMIMHLQGDPAPILLFTTPLCLNIFENVGAVILLDFAYLNFSDSVDYLLYDC